MAMDSRSPQETLCGDGRLVVVRNAVVLRWFVSLRGLGVFVLLTTVRRVFDFIDRTELLESCGREEDRQL